MNFGSEFGWGGSVNRRGTAHAYEGIKNVLRHYCLLDEPVVRIAPERNTPGRFIQAAYLNNYVPCPKDGIREPPDGRLLLIGNARPRSSQTLLGKRFANPDNRPPHVFARDGLRSYPPAIRELQREGRLRGHCRQRTRRHCHNRIESAHRHVKCRLRAMQGPRTKTTAWAVIQGIEVAQMIRKRQVLGITRRNLYGQAWVFEALLDLA